MWKASLKNVFLDGARLLPDYGFLWHTEMSRSGSSIALGGESFHFCPEIASDRRLSPVLDIPRRQAD
jgi:hypothetical protein